GTHYRGAVWQLAGTAGRNRVLFAPPTSTDIYTLSLHDALPILAHRPPEVATALELYQLFGGLLGAGALVVELRPVLKELVAPVLERKSTRLNSSHRTIWYAVFCLKKEKTRTRKER